MLTVTTMMNLIVMDIEMILRATAIVLVINYDCVGAGNGTGSDVLVLVTITVMMVMMDLSSGIRDCLMSASLLGNQVRDT